MSGVRLDEVLRWPAVVDLAVLPDRLRAVPVVGAGPARGVPLHVIGAESPPEALDAARAEPGLLLLAGLPLWDAWSRRGEGALLEALAYDHGTERLPAWRRMLAGADRPAGRDRAWLTGPLVDAALLVCTYGAAAAAELRRRHPSAEVRTLPPVVAEPAPGPAPAAGPSTGAPAVALDAGPELATLADSVRARLLARDVSVVGVPRPGDVAVSLHAGATGRPDGWLLAALAAGCVCVTTDDPVGSDLGAGNALRVEVDPIAVTEAVEGLLADPLRRRALATGGRLWALRRADPARLDAAFVDAAQIVSPPPPSAGAAPHREDAEPGLDVVGDIAVASGLGEAAAALLGTLVEAVVPLTFQALAYAGGEVAAQAPAQLGRALPSEPRYGRSLLLYNVHAMPGLAEEDLRPLTGDTYRIGYWMYEMPILPASLRDHLDRVDEVWAPATYSATSFQTALPDLPVRVIPISVRVHTSPGVDRSWWGIPPHRTVFLVTFAATSCDARKNPWGAIEAFRRAFPHVRAGAPVAADDPLLVVKAHHLRRVPGLARDLEAAVASVGGLLFADEMTRQETDDLHAVSDCYVSLHRAEGFGLGIAEAMHVGKPVISTAYSAPMDWTTSENCFLVPAGLTPVTEEQLRYQPHFRAVYPPGELWAEPEIGFAAAHMQTVVEDPAQTTRIARQGALDIRAHCSPTVVAQLVRSRLRELAAGGVRPARRP